MSGCFFKGFSAEIKRVKNLPCGGTQAFTVKFDPQGVNLKMGDISVIMPIQVHSGTHRHVHVPKYCHYFWFSVKFLLSCALVYLFDHVVVHCDLVPKRFLFVFIGHVWSSGPGAAVCTGDCASHQCFHRCTAVWHCAVWHVSGKTAW